MKKLVFLFILTIGVISCSRSSVKEVEEVTVDSIAEIDNTVVTDTTVIADTIQ